MYTSKILENHETISSFYGLPMRALTRACSNKHQKDDP